MCKRTEIVVARAAVCLLERRFKYLPLNPFHDIYLRPTIPPPYSPRFRSRRVRVIVPHHEVFAMTSHDAQRGWWGCHLPRVTKGAQWSGVAKGRSSSLPDSFPKMSLV